MSNSLTARQRRFIAEWQTRADGTQAAIAAGYSPRSARYTAYHLLNENPAVKAEIERVQHQLAEAAEYNGAKCMAECDAAIRFAEKTNNANALARLIELKAKLTGLLREKLDVSIDHRIDISDALAAARSRATLRPMRDLVEAVDAEFKALPGFAPGGAIDNESPPPFFAPLDLNL
ncbi:MAG TPA: terminase small subunit [Frateuria sp.]|uniref:terminase small subunit n=1 Tax=Frateuria sp. TaxID=2211372 RepID=UPI002DF56EF8|nr:terminase small subunit [Frateuria sp.]